MKEIWAIYNTNEELPDGGHPIDGGAGRIDQEWEEAHLDGSTMSERIPQIITKKAGRKAIYIPHRNLPDPEIDKIRDDGIVEMTEEDKAFMEARKPKSEIEILEKKIAVLEKQISG